MYLSFTLLTNPTTDKVFFIREKAWEEGLFKFSKLYYSAKPYSINIFNIKENKCFE
jgi:hypothetical protein